MKDIPILYLCDGKACRKHKENCYLDGGYCFYTEKANHSISLSDPDFPQTTTNLVEGTLFEEIDNAKLLYDYVTRGRYRKKAGGSNEQN